MSFVIEKPLVVEFETVENRLTKKHIRKAFLTSFILTRADLKHGYLEVGTTRYYLYISYELDLLFSNPFTDRVSVMASYQEHTNNACIVLCKVYHQTNIRNQEYVRVNKERRKLIEKPIKKTTVYYRDKEGRIS